MQQCHPALNITGSSGHLQYLRTCAPDSISTRQHVGSGRRLAKQNWALSSQREISQKPSIITSKSSIISASKEGTFPKGHPS